MPKITEELIYEIERLVGNASLRREMLLTSGLRKSRVKRLLTIISGVLALFSAGTVAGVLTEIVGGKGMQVMAALTAGVSGIISLILGTDSK